MAKNRESAARGSLEPQRLRRGDAQMWEHLPIVTAATVAERIARNVGVKHAEVITARIVQDERGWLRLAS
jgi:hypothetical protein